MADVVADSGKVAYVICRQRPTICRYRLTGTVSFVDETSETRAWYTDEDELAQLSQVSPSGKEAETIPVPYPREHTSFENAILTSSPLTHDHADGVHGTPSELQSPSSILHGYF